MGGPGEVSTDIDIGSGNENYNYTIIGEVGGALRMCKCSLILRKLSRDVLNVVLKP